MSIQKGSGFRNGSGYVDPVAGKALFNTRTASKITVDVTRCVVDYTFKEHDETEDAESLMKRKSELSVLRTRIDAFLSSTKDDDKRASLKSTLMYIASEQSEINSLLQKNGSTKAIMVAQNDQLQPLKEANARRVKRVQREVDRANYRGCLWRNILRDISTPEQMELYTARVNLELDMFMDKYDKEHDAGGYQCD